MKRFFIPIAVLVLMVTSGVLVGCGQPDYFKAPGERVHLVNNSRAFDHTWQEVVAFLEWDATDREAYTTEHMCGFFAEKLHNRAEYYGFKTAFVVVEFETGEPHALNAFNTVDYGLVYVDCTGKGHIEALALADKSTELAPVGHWDKVAYIVEGEKMGFISLGYDKQNFSYDWYNECRAKLVNFKKDLEKYNEAFEAEETPEEYLMRIIYGVQKLQAERNRLITEWEQVRGYNWEESDSYVSRIRIYW